MVLTAVTVVLAFFFITRRFLGRAEAIERQMGGEADGSAETPGSKRHR